MSCLEMPRSPVPDFLGESQRAFNDAETMQPRAPAAVPADARNGARVKTQDVRPEGVYRPNYNFLTPNMRSPEYVQMSTAAAITLGVMGGYMHRTSCTRCLNLLLTYPEGCRANCAYCGLARHREADRNYADRNFIRVDWPAVPYDQVIDIVASGGDGGRFHRMCISMITHPRSDADTPSGAEKMGRARQACAGIDSVQSDDDDAAGRAGAERPRRRYFHRRARRRQPEVFDRTRGSGVQSPHSWDKYWEILHAAAEIFGPERFGAHLIVGMGESDHDVLTQVQKIRDLGGHSHMFAFFPERGSLMDHLPPAPRPQWRRIQLARYLIDYRNHRLERMRFDAQRHADRFRPAAGRDRCRDQCRRRLPHLGLSGQGGRRHFGLRPALWRFAAARHRLLSVQAEPQRYPQGAAGRSTPAWAALIPRIAIVRSKKRQRA